MYWEGMYFVAPVPDILRMEDFGQPKKKVLDRIGLIKNAEIEPGWRIRKEKNMFHQQACN